MKRSEFVDVVVTLDAQRPVSTMAIRLLYDPSTLHLRRDEPNLTADGRVLPRVFIVDRTASDGVTLVMTGPPVEGEAGIRLAQFEAMREGATAIVVAEIRLADPNGMVIGHSLTRAKLSILVE